MNLEDIEKYSNFAYTLSSALISNQHLKYDMVGELVKNLSISEKYGIEMYNILPEENIPNLNGQDIWELLEINKNATLRESAIKDLDLNKIIENYGKLSDNIKKTFGLETDLSSENYDESSMLFDPITSMLLAKELVDKNYYIQSDEDGYDAIFNSDGVKIHLSLEIDSIIEEIKAKYNLSSSNFGDIFSSGTLGDYLDSIRPPESADLNEILNFINFSYSKDIRTGKRNASFTFGVSSLNDDVVWNRITSNISNKAIPVWVAPVAEEVGKFLISYGASKGLDKVINVWGESSSNYLLSGSQLTDLVYHIAFKRHGMGWSDSQISGYYGDLVKDAGRMVGVAATLFNNLENKEDKLKNKKKTATQELLNAEANLFTQKRLYDSINSSTPITERNARKSNYEKAKEEVKKKKANVENIDDSIKNNIKAQIKASNNYTNKKKDEEKKKKIKKDADKYLKEHPKPDQSCAFEAMSEACDSGVSPAGTAKVQASLSNDLLQEIDKHIRNLPYQECNIITRSCDNNSIEVTAEEMKVITDSINAKLMSDDAGCTWSPMGECSFFSSSTQSGVSYIDLLWDPVDQSN